VNTSTELPRYEFGFASDTGQKRKGEPNQDALQIIPAAQPLLILADGMGGYHGGAIASDLVVQAFKDEYEQSANALDCSQILQTCAKKAHIAIRMAASRDPNLQKMGSTVVAAVLGGDKLHVLNVGDSRAYLIRGMEIVQVSQDQTWVADQVRRGALTKEQAQVHPNRSRLSMSITAKRPTIEAFVSEESLQAEDIVVLCSDGLWGVIPETLIWAAVTELDPQTAADRLAALANTSSGPDNISVIVARRSDIVRQSLVGSVDDTNPGLE
jgi:PPM family protein phosphatase